MKKVLTKAVLDIEKQLTKHQKTAPQISLLSGTGAFSLFYHMLYEHSGKRKHLKKFEAAIENLFFRLNEEDYPYTYCDGLSGISFLLNFYQQNNILRKIDVAEALESFDALIINALFAAIDDFESPESELSANSFLDFLHGSLGNLYYLNDRLDENYEIATRVKTLFKKIGEIILEDLKTSGTEANHFNCGLAHGVCAYILVFSRFLSQHPDNKTALDVVKECTKHLISLKTTDQNTVSQFPSSAIFKAENSYEVSLGWCYGDQSVALAIHKAGEVLGDENLKKTGLEIALKAIEGIESGHYNKRENMDAGLCHGTAGIALLNKRWYQISKEERFDFAYDFLLKETLDLGEDKTTVGKDYKMYGGADLGYIPSIGLLDGICGVGIFYLDYLDNSDLEWDRLFLLR